MNETDLKQYIVDIGNDYKPNESFLKKLLKKIQSKLKLKEKRNSL